MATGIDTDGGSVERARLDHRANGRTQFVVGDVLSYPFDPESFDVVGSIAMLHHVDATEGLRRMRELVRPGGVIAIIGFARPSTFTDAARGVMGVTYKRGMQLRGRYWEHHAPTCWPPPLSMAEMRSLVDAELHGARFSGLMSGRYGVVWSKPGD